MSVASNETQLICVLFCFVLFCKVFVVALLCFVLLCFALRWQASALAMLRLLTRLPALTDALCL